MPEERQALLKESVSFRKSNDGAILKGELELYDDRVVLKTSHRLALSTLARTLPPTFPDAGIGESIPFSGITAISWGTKKAVLSRNVKIEIRTDEDLTWDIKGSARIREALQKAYHSWKHSIQQ